MYERQPRLAIDALLNIGYDALEAHPSDYVSKLKARLTTEYDAASKEANANTCKYKQIYDRKVSNSVPLTLFLGRLRHTKRLTST